MLRILYYLCTKSGKISAKKGGGLTLRHVRTLRNLRYLLPVVYGDSGRFATGLK